MFNPLFPEIVTDPDPRLGSAVQKLYTGICRLQINDVIVDVTLIDTNYNVSSNTGLVTPIVTTFAEPDKRGVGTERGGVH